MALVLRAASAVYVAFLEVAPDRPGFFAITEPDGVPPDLDRLAADLSGSGQSRRVELPCGPAVTITEFGRYGVGGQVPVVQEHALVVHPDDRRVVVFTLGAAGTERSPEQAHLFAEILATVSFDD